MRHYAFVTDPLDKKQKPEKIGMECSDCKSKDIVVANSRSGVFADCGTVVRVRRCNGCGNKWKTYEMTEALFKGEKAKAAKRLIEIALAQI